ncbi:hypothetical protein GCM10011414_22200 [Croceivirga lutea]|uniref:DinB family protein n=1 Tax=Croceivirga lutea TaxID=1775167 RepID=UPI00163A803E|nr:DinB family protein [Croceivirga lutea]GGG52207.1 hypothetical protein GCM10011414_22200 [Croceivirga lutea]
MNVQNIIKELENNYKVFQALFVLHIPDLKLYKPNKDVWCFLEIACHLVDEEIFDFRKRVLHTLHTPNDPLVPITPEEWPKNHHYLKQNFEEVVSCFLNERKKSINVLNKLENVNWNNSLKHPKFGEISAKRFLVNWLAHDYHHIRQLNRLKYNFLKSSIAEDLSYAGKW